MFQNKGFPNAKIESERKSGDEMMKEFLRGNDRDIDKAIIESILK